MGMERVKTEPLPSSDSTLIVPPWSMAMFWRQWRSDATLSKISASLWAL